MKPWKTLEGLPGNSTHKHMLDQVIRVDHAGEYGAKRIYEGQLAVLRGKEGADVIRHMADQEAEHLDTFTQLMIERRVRPTLLMPLWHIAGFALGAGTALLGKNAAMACTVAVESVIDEHYAGQEKSLPPEEAELKNTIARFRAEEMEHHDTGLAHGAESTPAYPLLTGAIRGATRLAIWLSIRI